MNGYPSKFQKASQEFWVTKARVATPRKLKSCVMLGRRPLRMAYWKVLTGSNISPKVIYKDISASSMEALDRKFIIFRSSLL
jgi:hypothetical protein